MNNRFSPPHHHTVHTSPPYFTSLAAPYPSPNWLPSVAEPQQGEFGYSAPRNYRSSPRSSPQGEFGYSAPRDYRSTTRSSHLYPIQEFPPCCPPLAQSYPPSYPQPYAQSYLRGFAHSRSLRPAIEPTDSEQTSSFVTKDSYWSSLPAASYAGIRQQVARKFVDFRFAHKKAQRVAFQRRPFAMSSSTALLPKDRKKQTDDHPIFLRVCHSPWIAIGQQALVILRGITAAYLAISFGLIIHYDLKVNQHGWLTAFEFSNIVYLLQVIYAWIALLWTFMHLHYPHHCNQIPTGTTRIQSLLSPPRQNPTTKNRSFFSIFYTAAVTYPHVVTFIHWAILIPNHETTIPVDKIFTQGWYTTFFVLNKFAINSFIALIEVVIYSSIRRQDPLGAHILGMSILSLLYVGWAFVGYKVTEKFAYFFFDNQKVGWDYVGISVAGFVVLTNIWLAFVYGLTGIRETMTKRSEDKSYGYARLPQ